MAGYYAYLTGVDGRVSKRVAIVCEDDEEAKRFAKQRWTAMRWSYGKTPVRSRSSNQSSKGRQAAAVGHDFIPLDYRRAA